MKLNSQGIVTFYHVPSSFFLSSFLSSLLLAELLLELLSFRLEVSSFSAGS